MKFNPERIAIMRKFNEQLTLTGNQRIIAYAVQAMFEQLASRVEIDHIAAYGLIWKSMIEFHETNGLKYIHGDEMEPEERIKRTKGVLEILENYLIATLERPEEQEEIKKIIADMFQEYKEHIAFRDL